MISHTVAATEEWTGTEPAAQPAVSFRNVSKTFANGTAAIESVDLDVHRGELVAIVGPSGCGKSTLLRIASGLTPPSSGQIHVVDGTRIGYVFQDPTLLPWRSVRRNIELLAELERIPPGDRQRLVAEAIARTGLQGFEHHLPRTLSGGMRMRVSLARSLALRPDVFLFDEPFGALDEITRERLNDELLTLFLATPFTGLFVTHSVTEATFLASRVIVMSARPGRVVAEVAVPFAYPRMPDLRFTAEFGRVAASVSAALREGWQ